jgi:hypothetical protein
MVSEVELSHRFIHVIFKENFSFLKKRIDSYIKYLYDLERDGLKLHKIE